MDTSMAPVVPPFGRRLFGYDRSEVDQFLLSTIAECRAQLDEARRTDVIRGASAEIAALLRAFAESVAIMHDEAERKAAETIAHADAKAATTLTDAQVEAARIRDDAVATARAATDEARAREADSERLLREARAQAEHVLEDAHQQAESLLTSCTSELDTRFKAISAQRMMTEQQVARAAEHLAGVLSALRSLDGLTETTAPFATPFAGSEVPPEVTAPPKATARPEATTGPTPEWDVDEHETTSDAASPPPIAVDLNEGRTFPTEFARWVETR